MSNGHVVSQYDVFLSYASRDFDRAIWFVELFKQQKWEVFWDWQSIPYGKDFDAEIDRALAASRCVVVLWTTAAATSRWVKLEAMHGQSRGVLLPVMLDNLAPDDLPFALRILQAVHLYDWNDQKTLPRLQRLLDTIGRLTSGKVGHLETESELPLPGNRQTESSRDTTSVPAARFKRPGSPAGGLGMRLRRLVERSRSRTFLVALLFLGVPGIALYRYLGARVDYFDSLPAEEHHAHGSAGPPDVDKDGIAVRVFFENLNTDLRPVDLPGLEKLAAKVGKSRETVDLVARSCSRGTQEFSMAFADRYAQLVRQYLIAAGVSANQLSIVSRGPVDAICLTEATCARDHRVDIALSETPVPARRGN